MTLREEHNAVAMVGWSAKKDGVIEKPRVHQADIVARLNAVDLTSLP
jgi:hypothetical protein